MVLEKINITANYSGVAEGIRMDDYEGEGSITLSGVKIDVTGKHTTTSYSPRAMGAEGSTVITVGNYSDAFPLVVTVTNEATSPNGYAYAFDVDAGTAKYIINGGTFTMNAAGRAAVVNGQYSTSSYANIYGGYFTLNSSSGVNSVGYSDKNATVYGGYFNIDPSASAPDGYAAVTAADGKPSPTATPIR